MTWILFIVIAFGADSGLKVERLSFERESDCRLALMALRKETEHLMVYIDGWCLEAPQP